ncbi:hypothetical protein FGADI_12787 [Fusarium gaditjirri]|uniref:Uncharacterized protein n=1 Tax=Fusarium gaditjirri TaxID=282569 RepID=A0A8H4SRF7_9HYPO|nr:hypothetical protein FGADI_12787 [Fusarium gaditjirri]
MPSSKKTASPTSERVLLYKEGIRRFQRFWIKLQSSNNQLRFGRNVSREKLLDVVFQDPTHRHYIHWAGLVAPLGDECDNEGEMDGPIVKKWLTKTGSFAKAWRWTKKRIDLLTGFSFNDDQDLYISSPAHSKGSSPVSPGTLQIQYSATEIAEETEQDEHDHEQKRQLPTHKGKQPAEDLELLGMPYTAVREGMVAFDEFPDLRSPTYGHEFPKPPNPASLLHAFPFSNGNARELLEMDYADVDSAFDIMDDKMRQNGEGMWKYLKGLFNWF